MSLMMSNSNHKYTQRVNVMMKKYGLLELRAAKAEAELAEAQDRINSLNEKIERQCQTEEMMAHRENEYGPSLIFDLQHTCCPFPLLAYLYIQMNNFYSPKQLDWI